MTFHLTAVHYRVEPSNDQRHRDFTREVYGLVVVWWEECTR